MKTKTKTFDAVRFMREQRAKMSEKFAKMSKEEILAYVNNVDSDIKPGGKKSE